MYASCEFSSRWLSGFGCDGAPLQHVGRRLNAENNDANGGHEIGFTGVGGNVYGSDAMAPALRAVEVMATLILTAIQLAQLCFYKKVYKEKRWRW